MRPVFSLSLAMALTLPGIVHAAPPSPEPAPAADTVERLVWRGAPIRIDLRLSAERTVRLPGTTTLRSGLLGGPVPGLRIQALGDHLYLKADQAFASTRMLVQADTGQSILLDLAADKSFAAGAPIEVLSNAEAGAAGRSTLSPVTSQPVDQPVGYVSLVRHAAQSLYAPLRLRPRSGTIARAPLRTGESLNLVRGGHVEAIPVAGWRTNGSQGSLWVSAVKLRNRLGRGVTLDPRDLRGQWQAASFQHARLGPAGDETDTTTVYLVSNQDFEAALGPFATPHTQVAP